MRCDAADKLELSRCPVGPRKAIVGRNTTEAGERDCAFRKLNALALFSVPSLPASGDLRIVQISRFENRHRTAIFFTLLPSKYLLPPFFFCNQGEAQRRLTGILPRIHRFSNRPISTIFTPPLASCNPVKLLRPSVYTVEPGATFCLRKAVRVVLLKSGMTAIRMRPVARPRFSTATRTSAAFRPLSWRLPRKPA